VMGRKYRLKDQPRPTDKGIHGEEGQREAKTRAHRGGFHQESNLGDEAYPSAAGTWARRRLRGVVPAPSARRPGPPCGRTQGIMMTLRTVGGSLERAVGKGLDRR